MAEVINSVVNKDNLLATLMLKQGLLCSMLQRFHLKFILLMVGRAGRGAGAGGEADIKTDNLLKCVLCQILSGRWYQPSLVRSTTFKSSDCEGRAGLGWAGRCLAVISFVKH